MKRGVDLDQRSFQEIVELELAYEHTYFVKSSAEAAFVQLVSVSETIKIREINSNPFFQVSFYFEASTEASAVW